MVRRRMLVGRSVRAICWIGTYDQMGGAPSNPLTYAADGITADGRFLVFVRASVSHPSLPKDVVDLNGVAVQAFRARLAHQLNEASPDSFEPSLAHLDAMVQSSGIR